MSNFKDQLKRDISDVFHNADEFAEAVEIKYNGRVYNDIPIVVDSDVAKERTKASGDNSEGVYTVDLTVFVSFEDLEIVPRKETPITIDGVEYSIVNVAFNAGEITLDLEMLDE